MGGVVGEQTELITKRTWACSLVTTLSNVGGRWEAKEKRGGDLNFFQGVRTSGKISWEEVRMRKS